MTKLEITRDMADRTGLSLADATRATDAFVEILKDAFASGNNIYIRQFGTFALTNRKAKKVRNIKEHRSYIAPAHNTIVFKPSKSLTIKQ